MSTGIDVAACVTGASGVATVAVAGHPLTCTASDGTQGSVSVLHLSLVDSSSDTPFDYTQAFGFWSLAFTSVVLLYFGCLGIGTVVNFIRRA